MGFSNWFLELPLYQQVLAGCAVVGGIISIMRFIYDFTILPLWKWINQNYYQLKVCCKFEPRDDMRSVVGNSETQIYLVLNILNKGNSSVHIRQPKFTPLNINTKMFHHLVPNDEYPIEIKAGDEFTKEYLVQDLYKNWLSNFDDNYRIKFEVETTKGATFKSKEFNEEQVNDWLEIAKG